MLSSLYFVSSNQNKFEEARSILATFGISLKLFKCNLEEIQAETLQEVAQHKATQAYLLCSKPVIVEDAGLFIKSLKGFPGPYSSFAFDTLGNRGILKLLSKQRSATFRSVIAYCERKGDVMLFESSVEGKISKKLQGKRWGFDPIFIPEGRTLTYSQLKNKNQVSHRSLALKKFANWYLHRQISSG
ncbi:MAG: RdgB/HAM1 family non-canonical purine NTP pyrophosphatase [Thaumarchaeota archaeon]|nr:RdgB/HAM1 family non-canonical purine NTP pyrophosphatase [Nitrososphaerota archaeon]